MVVWTLLLAASLTAQAEPAAEVVTLRDGSTILGQILTAPPAGKGSGKGTGSKGVQPIQVLVRRGWAEAHQKERLAAWDHVDEPAAQRAASVQRERLTRWRREREKLLPETERRNDRILTWIDRQLERLDAPGDSSRSPLVIARIPRSEVKSLGHKPATMSRLLALAWLCDLPEPEAMPADALKDAIEGRGLIADVSRPVNLDRLLPPAPESEARWLARRAATEVTVDPGLRFIRYQDLVLPDAKNAQLFDQLALGSGLSDLKKLLDPGENSPDPLVERFEKIEANGRIGAVVTRLTIPTDLSSASVDVTLWVRVGPKRWVSAGSQSASVRPDDLAADAGNELADDPQIQSVFRLAQALGLGQVAQELKQRSLRIGAATQKALDNTRSTFQTGLDTLAFPVFRPEPSREKEKPSEPALQPENGKPRK